MPYLLDTNIFIESYKRFYGFDFCPAFWDWLIKQNEAGQVFSIEKVLDEIKAGDDELVSWAKKRSSNFFIKPTSQVLEAIQKIADQVKQSYTPEGVKEFLDSADCYLIAQALAENYQVVTLEKTSNSKHRIKIPDVCEKFQVECISPFEMLSREKAEFVLNNGDNGEPPFQLR